MYDSLGRKNFFVSLACPFIFFPMQDPVSWPPRTLLQQPGGDNRAIGQRTTSSTASSSMLTWASLSLSLSLSLFFSLYLCDKFHHLVSSCGSAKPTIIFCWCVVVENCVPNHQNCRVCVCIKQLLTSLPFMTLLMVPKTNFEVFLHGRFFKTLCLLVGGKQVHS